MTDAIRFYIIGRKARRYTDALHFNMMKEPLKQANFRLPKTLLDDLRTVSQMDKDSQSEIVRKSVAARVKRLKLRHKITEQAVTV